MPLPSGSRSTDAIPTSRRRGAPSMSDWVTSWARASIRGGVERWDGVDVRHRDRPSTPSIDERLDGRLDVSGWKGSSFGIDRPVRTIRSTTARRGQCSSRAGTGVASDPRRLTSGLRATPGARVRAVARTSGDHGRTDARRADWPTDLSTRPGEVQRWWAEGHAFGSARPPLSMLPRSIAAPRLTRGLTWILASALDCRSRPERHAPGRRRERATRWLHGLIVCL